ncbi:MAG: MCP four helix bundle domain-containing protein, partial [Clostridiaceae bacterium]
MKTKIIFSLGKILKLISKPFNNLRLKHKLTIGFAMIILSFIMVAGFSVSDMKKMNGNSNAVYNESLIPIQLL